MLVMMAAPGAAVSVMTMIGSEAGPSRFFVKPRTTIRYLVNGPKRRKNVLTRDVFVADGKIVWKIEITLV